MQELVIFFQVPGIKYKFLLLLVKSFTTKINLQPIEQSKLIEKKLILCHNLLEFT